MTDHLLPKAAADEPISHKMVIERALQIALDDLWELTYGPQKSKDELMYLYLDLAHDQLMRERNDQ